MTNNSIELEFNESKYQKYKMLPVEYKSSHVSTNNDRKMKKKMKLSDTITLEDLLQDWTQCNHLMIQKKRLCNIARVPGSNYCGLHRPIDEQEQERITCPLEPTHTVYKSNLSSHLKICTATSRNKELEALPYFRYNCNTFQDIYCQDISSNKSQVNPDELLIKIKNIYNNLIKNQLLEPLIDENMDSNRDDDIFKKVCGDKVAFDKTRHVIQDIEIIHQMSAFGILSYANESNSNISKNTFIELGAGRGVLGLSVSLANPNAKVIFVERTGLRTKADKLMKSHNRDFIRTRMDIRHVYLPNLPGVIYENVEVVNPDSDKNQLQPLNNVIIIAKHLCGVATDLALASIRNMDQRSMGIAIATCCHHACSIQDYSGQSWIRSIGFTETEFELMSSWSGWAHIDINNIHHSKLTSQEQQHSIEKEVNDEKHIISINTSNIQRPKNISAIEMIQVGQMIKRILDQGRIEFLRSLGYEANQVRFCDPKYSPECMLILAKKSF